MFENQQDTTLLLYSFLSALKRIDSKESNSERTFDLEDENDAVTVISSTVDVLIHDTLKSSSLKETLNKQLHLQRRCHAAIFFTVLRSNGINCAEANKYYETVNHSFPTLSWKFYMKLNFQCKWSEYFVECSQELQPDILSAVLKKILHIEWEEEHMKYYSWHSILQAIIWNFFIIEDSTLSSSQDCCSFAFPFVSPCLTTETSCSIFEKDKESAAKSQILHSFVTILNHLQATLVSSPGSFDLIKIILHAHKTIFKLLSKVKTCDKNIVKELFRLNKIMETCFSNKLSLNAIEAFLQGKDERIPLSHYYALTSWDISGNYLVFLLCNYWKDILEIASEEADSPCVSLKDYFPLSSIKEQLRKLSPLFKTKFEKDGGNYVLSLRIIVSLHYPCATRAAVILLLHPEVRESDEVLITLEKEISKLNALELYPVLADAVATTQCKDVKMRLLNLFFKILSESCGQIYNDALEYILNHYGINNHFQLDDFEDQLISFTRKMMSDDEAEKCLLPLFIQCPRDVLKMLIEEALFQGSEEITVIKILKLIPIACLHSDSLIKELKPYFTKNEVVVKEMSNMTNLIESLMKIHAETQIVDFNIFLLEVIGPNLAAEKKVSFTLECLNVSLNVLIPKNVFKIKTEALSLLVQSLSSIIDKCIKLGDGKIKELAVTTLSLLSKGQGITDTVQIELWGNLSSYSPSVLVYVSKLFKETSYNDLKRAESELDDSLWLWCCNFKDFNLFQATILKKKMSYKVLVSVLISILPHLTKEEWFESANLIQECVQNSNLDASYSTPQLLPESDPQLYAVIRCLMDSYYFALKKGVYDLSYVSNCFTNTVQQLLRQKVNLHLYLNVFLDTCHLTLGNMDDVYICLLPFLLTVKKFVEDECKDKDLKTMYIRLMHHGIKCLPNSREKMPFFTDNSVKANCYDEPDEDEFSE